MTDRQQRKVSSERRNLVKSSSPPTYDVFISHAGEDKATIAIPLRQKLAAHGISAFVDEEDMQPGTSATRAMTDAMETAALAVVVISPEFVARKWPMKELMCFLNRSKDERASHANRPVIIPFFYRLNVAELYEEPNFDRKDDKGKELYVKSRFSERMKAGEPEADVTKVKEALRKLHDIMGIRNYVNAQNDSTLEMSQRREVLLEKLRDEVVKAMPQKIRYAVSAPTSQEAKSSSETLDQFRKSFPPLTFSVPAVLDFDGRDEGNNPIKPEGWTKQHLLHETSNVSRVVAIHGIGGVGKSTILQALATDEDIRRQFPDGVHVMKLGQDATETKLFKEICRVLKASGAEKEVVCLRTANDVGEALDEFERWFEKRHCAFLIDDAWTRGIGMSAWSRLCKIASAKTQNRILITTRENEIASLAPSDRVVHMEARDVRGSDSREILFFHADDEHGNVMSEMTENAINLILDRCGGLPVGLSIAGKSVKSMKIGIPEPGDAWEIYNSRVTCYPSILWERKLDEYRGLFTTFATSLNSLDERRSRGTLGLETKLPINLMYRRLCVLPKHETVPGTMLRYLWEAESIAEAEIIATAFIELGLAKREVGIWGEEVGQWGLSLHDSLHDFAVIEARRHEETKEAHESVLVGYSSCDEELCFEVNGTRKWWCPELVQDGYIHRNLSRHLRGAGSEKELINLLMMPSWAARQLDVNGILNLEDDFLIGIKTTQQGCIDETEAQRIDVERSLQLILDSFSMSWAFACSQNRRELWFQVYGRLVGLANEFVGIREYLKRVIDEEKRMWLRSANCVLSKPGDAKGKTLSVDFPVGCMLVMSGCERVACGSYDGWIVVINLTSSEIEKRWNAHEGRVLDIAIGKNGSRLISVSEDKSVKVWDFKSHRCVAMFEGHSDYVNCVALIGDGKHVVTGGDDNVAHVWEVETGQVVGEPFRGHKGRVTCMAVLEDGDHVVSGGSDKMLRLWNTKSGTQVAEPFVGHQDTVTCVTVSPDGKCIMSRSSDHTVRIWDIRSREQLGEPFTVHRDYFGGMSISRDGARVACVSSNTIRVWDVESRKEACDPLEGHAAFDVTGVSFLADRYSIVSSSLDGSVRLWNLQRTKAGRVENRHEQQVNRVAFSPNGSRVVSCSNDGTLRLWDVMSGQQIGSPLRGHSNAVSDVATMPDGQRVVSVSDDKTIRVWDMKSCKLLHELTGHTDCINCVALTPNGRFAVTGSIDGTVRAWDLMKMDNSHSVLIDSFLACERVFLTDDAKRVVCVNYRSAQVLERDTEQRDSVKKPIEFSWGASSMSRKQIMSRVGESTMHDDAGLFIPLWQHRISYGEEVNVVLATLESDIGSWALSPDEKTLSVGLMDGRVGFFKLENL